jgi:Ca-activated chloride channel family protein
MTIHSITFAHPIWLLGGLFLATVILVLGARLDRKRKLALAAFSSRRKGPTSTLSRMRRAFKRALLVTGALLGCVALARPQWGVHWEAAHRRGLDLLFALDTSKSMLAPDLKPDRLTRAKLAIRDLVSKFEGDRVGLVAFAGDAFLQCPLTLDRGVFEQTLDAIDTATIPHGGTDVGRAIEVARSALHNQPANHKLLVFLTDGEDLESHAVDAARAASSDGIHIYTVGVGTQSGELIPLGEPASSS